MSAATVSSKGQIVIPKKVREVLRIKPGDKVTVEVSQGAIVLRPVVTVAIPRDQAWFWSSEVQDRMKEAEENYRAGNYRTYDADELVRELEGRE